MSKKEKTRQKLVDSMRKTKVSAQEKSSSDAVTTIAKDKTASETKTVVRKPAVSTTSQQTKHTDPYQSGRRIWPD